MEDAGYAKVKVADRPDVFVLNTCSVTENADKECRRHVRRFQNLNPEGIILVIGCYAQLKPDEIAAIPGVDLVLGANEKFNVVDHLDKLRDKGESGTAISSAIKDVRSFVPGYSAGDRTRTFLKVQDGCDYFCSFCTIPLARGRSRSGSISEVVQLAHEIGEKGTKEIVLTGVNIGDFGSGSDEDFLQLVQALDKVSGIERFRISSIEPNLLSNEIIDFVATSERFAPHFHMPLQSGSDAILRRMRRRYGTALYAERVNRIKQRMPHACIGVDVITGTPGETDTEFEKTHMFLRGIPVDYLHVFTYSERANTTAVRMEDSVPMSIRRKRTKQLNFLSGKMRRAFYESQLGQVRPVLFEKEEHGEEMLGFTDNYVRICAPYSSALVNRLSTVSLGTINEDGHVTGAIHVERIALTERA
jgi:threonylcarbamoyladenosine tRNA methylthiotransferase MtaB